jgi:hypothetical protein
MHPLALWNEPIDIINGGPQFFKDAKDYILNTLSYDKETPTEEKHLKVQQH